MRILVSYDNRYRPDSTGQYYVKAFKNLGHDVTHVIPSEVNKSHIGYDLYFKCDDGVYSEWPKELHPSVYQVIDTHLDTDWRLKLEEKAGFDLVSVAQKTGVELPWKANRVMWGPLGCDVDSHSVGNREKKYDLAVIMNFHSQYASERIEHVHSLMEAVPNFFYGSRMFEEMAEKFSESRLVFNKSLNKDINMRVFEAMCSGSCLLTDRIDEMNELGLKDGIHYAGYSTKEEMCEVAKGLLKDEVRREAISKAGHLESIRNHTYTVRAEKILKELHLN